MNVQTNKTDWEQVIRARAMEMSLAGTVRYFWLNQVRVGENVYPLLVADASGYSHSRAVYVLVNRRLAYIGELVHAPGWGYDVFAWGEHDNGQLLATREESIPAALLHLAKRYASATGLRTMRGPEWFSDEQWYVENEDTQVY